MTIAKKFTLLLWVFLLPVALFSQCTPTALGSSQVISTNTSWNAGTYNINGDFTVNAGVTLTIIYNNNCPFIINATNINILGTINGDGAGARGGAGGAGGSSSGGAGGGSLAAGGSPGLAGGGTGGGAPGNVGGAASGGCSIDCGNIVCSGGNDADRAGGGGAGGGAGASYGAAGGTGGAGAAGRIENEPGNSRCNSVPVAGTAGTGNAAPAGYGNTAINNDLPNGSGGAGGGGGGGGFANGTAGGTGGNGGGSVNLNASADLVVSGIITASGTYGTNGGDGGARSGALGNWNCEACGNSNGGGANDCRDASRCGACTYYTWGWPGGGGGGAGGGSGGGIKVSAKGNMNLTGTLLANGGGGGNAGRPWQSDAACNNVAEAGGPGSGGVIKYVYNPCANNVFSPAAAQVRAGAPGQTGAGTSGTNTASAGVVLDETADIYIPGYSPVPPPTAASDQLLCGPGHAPAAISATGISGGTGTYSYQWYASTANANGQTGSNSTPAPGFNVVAGATGTVLNSAFTGTLSQTTYYQMKVTSGPCVGWSNVVTVTVAPLPSISNVAESDVLCNGGNTGSLTLTASSGTPAYTYSNDGGANYQSSNVFSGLSAGNYTLFVKDGNNCSSAYASNPANVAEPAVLSMTDSVVNASCANVSNGSVTVTLVTGGVSPYQYSLNSGPNQNGNAFSGLPQSDYLLQVTDNNGCTDTMTAVINNSYSVSASLDATTDVSCFGGSNGMATVSISGGVAPYLYSSDGTVFQTTPTLTGYSAGSFTATLKDDNGCIATVPVQISEPTQLVVQIDSASSVPCNSAALGSVYSSTTGGTPGTGYTYLWSNSATTQNISNLTAGAYTITTTDNNSCTASATGTVAVVSNFTTSASAASTTCFGSADGLAYVVVNNGTGPFGYTWTGGATTDTITGLAAGTYSVTVTDVNNCPSTATVTVDQPTAVSAQVTAIQPTCTGNTDAQAIVNANGGTAAYSFSWSNSATTDTVSNLAPGSYSVTVLDANSCSASASTTITNPSPVLVSLLTTGDSCFGQQNGSVQVDATGGSAPYTYAWSNSSTGGYLNNLAAGTYTVTTSDSHHCSVTASAVIVEPAQMQIFTSSTGDVNNQGTGTATVDSVSGGTPPYFITGWSNGETVNPITGLAVGSYTVTVVDHHGCEQTATVAVSFVSGIATAKNDLSFDVYPNPAKTEINISLNDISKEGVPYVSVKDVLGHVLIAKTLSTPQTKIDVSTLANGVYMVELKRGDKKVVKQIVVNK